MDKPDVDEIIGICPAISIRQKMRLATRAPDRRDPDRDI